MAKMVKYRAKCAYCGEWCEAGKAFLQRIGHEWKCQCLPCYEKKKVTIRGGQ